MAGRQEEVSWLDVPESISYEKGDLFFEDWESGTSWARAQAAACTCWARS